MTKEILQKSAPFTNSFAKRNTPGDVRFFISGCIFIFFFSIILCTRLVYFCDTGNRPLFYRGSTYIGALHSLSDYQLGHRLKSHRLQPLPDPPIGRLYRHTVQNYHLLFLRANFHGYHRCKCSHLRYKEPFSVLRIIISIDP